MPACTGGNLLRQPQVPTQQRGEEEGHEEEECHGQGCQARAPPLTNARGRLDEARDGRGSQERPHHAGNAIHAECDPGPLKRLQATPRIAGDASNAGPRCLGLGAGAAMSKVGMPCATNSAWAVRHWVG